MKRIKEYIGFSREELIRLKDIMKNVSAGSVVIINELFATTTSHDAYMMGKKYWNISFRLIAFAYMLPIFMNSFQSVKG